MDVVTNLNELRHHSGTKVCALADENADKGVDGLGALGGSEAVADSGAGADSEAGADSGAVADPGAPTSNFAATAAHELGLNWPPENHQTRRPSVIIGDGEIDLVLRVLKDNREFSALRIKSRGEGLLAIGDQFALRAVRSALESSGDAHWEPVVAAVLAVARQCEEALADIDDDCQELAKSVIGYASSAERRTIGRMRADLFRIGEVQAAHQNLVETTEELAEVVGTEHRRLLARASRAFEANQSATTRLYAMLGDVLSEQDSVVSERLTLVATIFLPLTLATGFFGMNFQWMVDRIGSFPAFLILGIVVPAALAVATLLLVRRLSRSK